MSQKLVKQFDDYCAKTIGDVQKLENYSTEILQSKPVPGKWSMIQLLDHLLSIEKGSLMYMMKKSADQELKKVKFKNRFYHFLTRIVLKSGKKVKAPAVVAEPSNEKDLATILKEFENIRSKMREFVSKWPEERHDQLIFRHPLAGMFTLKQTISFLSEHWSHHIPQQNEIVRSFK